jgi:hypothetical protein
MSKRGMRFRRKTKDGKWQHAVLAETLREGCGYRWVGCLALLEEGTGRWMYSGHWRAFRDGRENKTAIRQVKKLGWEEI